MTTLRPFIPSLAAMLLAAGGGASAPNVLIDKSEIRFVSRQAGGNIDGRFRKWRANVDFRPNEIAKSKAEFEIELGSIALSSEESEAEIKRAPWFDTAKFPVARFEATTMKFVGGNRYEMVGQLSMKGVTRDVVVPFALKTDGAGNSVADGKFTLNRRDFRLGDDRVADASAVDNEVAVRIRVVLPPVA